MGIFHKIKLNKDKLFSNHIYYDKVENVFHYFDKSILNIDLFEDILNEIPNKIYEELNINKEILFDIITNRISFIKSKPI